MLHTFMLRFALGQSRSELCWNKPRWALPASYDLDLIGDPLVLRRFAGPLHTDSLCVFANFAICFAEAFF